MQRALEKPLLVYTLVGLLILGPMLLPGYIFTLDMVFGPHIQLPRDITASYPFYAALKALNIIMPAWLIQKIILLTIITFSGLGAHRLTQYMISEERAGHIAPYFAGLLYIINPFTYTRFMDGHFAVLLGYAVLPFFTRALFALLFDTQTNFRQATRTAIYAAVCVICSVHAVGYIAIISLVAMSIFAAYNHRAPKALLKTAKYLGLAMLLFIVLNSFWLIPTALGNTPRETLIQNFDMRHFLSFRTDGATDLSVIGNAMSLHGYWGDREGRYTLPQNINPLWPAVYMVIFLVTTYGVYRTRHNMKSLTLTISAGIALILAIGIAATPFNYINQWLIDTIPFFRGFREPQKFLSVAALFYAVMGGVGISHLRTSRLLSKINPHQYPWVIGAILIMPFLYTPTFLAGFAGQLHAREYPNDWARANQTYISASSGKTLFLPWHQYMYFDFAGRVITNPAPIYFGDSVLAGDNVEIGLIRRQNDNPSSRLIEEALAKKDPTAFNQMLSRLHIEYVVVSKNADWQQYSFLETVQLERVSDTRTLQIYRNTSFR